jgi:Asp-tRNA(Asn)/Glu-tRNA(Gln) amidotransferase A subunit family amidase
MIIETLVSVKKAYDTLITNIRKIEMDLADLSAAELARSIREGEITSLDVVNACIARIEEREGEVGAWAHFNPKFAREQAERCDVIRASGIPTGPLHGIPVGIKDIFDTKDLPTENGTVLDAGREPMDDSTAVSRLKAAGCVIMGKTVTTEMAVYYPGKTTNPHDARRTPGGSSSGSAAAVACGMVPLAIGSQTNGSVIRPASFCGVVGFKPTHGRISRTGALALSRALDHVGVFTRTLEDAALISDCLIGFDSKDPDTKLTAAPQLHAIAIEKPPVAPSFAFARTPVWEKADPSTQSAFEELVEFLGPNCDEITLGGEFEDAHAHMRNIMYADLAKYLNRYSERGHDQISKTLSKMMAEGSKVSAVAYNTSMDKRVGINAQVQKICSDYDVVITPAAPGEAPIGLGATGDPAFCSIWSYLGTPAVTLPLLRGENGMPLGVQLISTKGDDARLLRTAQWLVDEVVRSTDD